MLLETAPQQSTSSAVLGHRVISVAPADPTATGRTHRIEMFGASAADKDERPWPARVWFEPPWKP
jgi:hypothetical protein